MTTIRIFRFHHLDPQQQIVQAQKEPQPLPPPPPEPQKTPEELRREAQEALKIDTIHHYNFGFIGIMKLSLRNITMDHCNAMIVICFKNEQVA